MYGRKHVGKCHTEAVNIFQKNSSLLANSDAVNFSIVSWLKWRLDKTIYTSSKHFPKDFKQNVRTTAEHQ